MSRLAVFAVFLLFVTQTQAQMFSHGVPAGATSPEADGRQHGIPSNVQSPTPLPPGVHRTFVFHGPVRRFGNPRDHHKVLVPVPVFYPIFGYGDVGYPADPFVQASSDPAPDAAASEQAAAEVRREQADAGNGEEQLRQAYLQGARDALRETLQNERNSRYGEHYMDSREQQRSRASNDSSSDNDKAVAPPPKEDNSPSTVFIFKDGHQIETRNFAIMGQTLYDFSGSTLRKVLLDDLNKDATVKANDDRGITVKLP